MPKKLLLAKLALLLFLLSPTYASNISFDFANPTTKDTSLINTSWAEINSTLEGKDIQEIIFNWNGTNYTIHDDSLVLAMNFDNNTKIGENSTRATDISKYGNIFYFWF